MPPDELDPTQTPQDPNSTQPLVQVDPATAVVAFMEWLQSREEPAGPFSAHYNAMSGNALVSKFCFAQGWSLEGKQVEQVVSLRKNYPA